MSTVAKYLRISNEDTEKASDAESASIVNQRHLLDNYLDTHSEFAGWDRIELCDDGWSGTNFERPGMIELLERVKKGLVQCIIVKDFSRFGRNYLTVGDYISRVFPFMGVRFISLGDGYDSLRPSDVDSLSVSFSTIIYDLYSKELSGKTRSGRDRIAANGEFLAPASPFGYFKEPGRPKHLIVDTAAAETVRLIFDMVCEGKATYEIAQHLNAVKAATPMQHKRNVGCTFHPWPHVTEDNYWDHGMVAKILRDERYTGCNIYGKRRRDVVGSTHTVKAARDKWIVTEDTHEAIISKEQFIEAQSKLRDCIERPPTKASAPLARKVYCGCCGRAMVRSHSKIRYYACRTPRFTDSFGCTDDRVMEEDILETVLLSIRTFAEVAVDLDNILAEQRNQKKLDRKQVQRKLMVLQSRKEQAERHLQDMYADLFDGTISKEEYLSRKQKVSDQIAQLDKEADALNAELALEQDSEASTIVARFKAYARIDSLTQENIRELLDRVTIYPGELIQVKINFADELKQVEEQLRANTATP